jgi:hypothetical protein
MHTKACSNVRGKSDGITENPNEFLGLDENECEAGKPQELYYTMKFNGFLDWNCGFDLNYILRIELDIENVELNKFKNHKFRM